MNNHDLKSTSNSSAELKDSIPIGLFYQNKNAPRYDEYGAHNIGMPVKDRITAINKELDKYAV